MDCINIVLEENTLFCGQMLAKRLYFMLYLHQRICYDNKHCHQVKVTALILKANLSYFDG